MTKTEPTHDLLTHDLLAHGFLPSKIVGQRVRTFGHRPAKRTGLKHRTGFCTNRFQYAMLLILSALTLSLTLACNRSTGTEVIFASSENQTDSNPRQEKSNASSNKTGDNKSVGEADENQEEMSDEEMNEEKEDQLAIATFGNGCFWCTEAVFQRLKGVKKVVSGYSGGQIEDPSYEAVCTGRTGHAEVLQIEYDPKVISFDKLLEVFWKTHDPTTLNRQGNDVGTQYRSAVFYHDAKQKELAEKYKKLLNESGAFSNPIVTEITAFKKFYAADNYHQNYYNLNKNKNPYCGMIEYKLEKFRKAFKDVIDEEKDKVK